MIKLLLADDEPLVLIGLQSMLRWEEYDIEICATARNGEQALALIEEHRPDIVVTDIKMPLMTGLELAGECRARYGALPVFLMLTSYEEFGFVKDAIRTGAVDYLVKLELTPQSLAASIARAIERVRDAQKSTVAAPAAERGGLQNFRDKFFIRLYNNLFENEEQYALQRADLNLDFSAERYVVAYCEIGGMDTAGMDTDKLLRLYGSTVQMARDNIQKYLPCYVTSLDMRHFNILFCLSEEIENWVHAVREALEKTITIVYNYFSVQLLCAIGHPVDQAFCVSESYHSARCIFPEASALNPLAIDKAGSAASSQASIFNMAVYKTSLTRAFEELDVDALHSTITEIVSCFSAHPSRHVQAMDAACNLLYMAISLLPEGEKTVEQIFTDSPDGYRSLYKQTSTDQCCRWMLRLRDGLCEILQSRRQNYKERIVANVQEYINANLDKKLSLGEVAAAFSFSPNYLSQLFTQYAEGGFVGYITDAKISAAKEMMKQGDMKIYEIAEKLGYENAFYFSRVFKKLTGLSPREYIQNKTV